MTGCTQTDEFAVVQGSVPDRHIVVTVTGTGAERVTRLYADGAGQGVTADTPSFTTTSGEVPGTARFELPAGLAGRTVSLWARIANSDEASSDAAGAVRPLATGVELAMPPKSGEPQTLYLGSCLRPQLWGRDFGILRHITDDARRHPSPAMIWLGDSLYYSDADVRSAESMTRAHQSARRDDDLRHLLAVLPNYSIWDDHDYGPNNADRHFDRRRDSQQVFRSHWANPPPAAAAGRDGALYTSVRRGDVELFLTDNRSARDPIGKGPAGVLLGDTQVAWLKEGLRRSNAKLKLIVGGSQWLADDRNEEGWHHYPAERQALLDWLASANIGGTLFVSGDRHHSVLLERPWNGRTFTELTCSALTSEVDQIVPKGYKNVHLRAAVETNNFCRLDIAADGRIQVSFLDAKGAVIEGPLEVRPTQGETSAEPN